MSFGSPTPIEIVVSGANYIQNREFAELIRREIVQIPQLRDVQIGQSMDYPAVQVNVDRERAGLAGLMPVDVPEQEAFYVDAGYDDTQGGDPVTIISSSLPGGKVETRLTRTSEKLDTQSRSLLALIDLENHENRLRPGGFVTVRIQLERRPDVLTLPLAAIVRQGSETICYQIIDGKVHPQPIELGLRVGDDVEILSGLSGDEAVVLARANSLQPGHTIEVIR